MVPPIYKKPPGPKDTGGQTGNLLYKYYTTHWQNVRISQDYLKKMRKDMPCSAVVNFPYDNVNGYYQYPENIRSDMEEFMIQIVSEYVDKDRIFMWK